MDRLIYTEVSILCGGGITKEVVGWMYTMFTYIENAFNSGGIVPTFIDAFKAIACALLVLYFVIDLVSQVSRDMFSFDRLVLAFVKLIAAFALFLQLTTILSALVVIAKNLFIWVGATAPPTTSKSGKTFSFFQYGVKNSSKKKLGEFPTYEWCDKNNELEEYTGFGGLVAGLGVAGTLLIPFIIGIVAKFVCYFVTTSMAVAFIGRAIFSPLAIVQVFEGGTSSSGMRYLKSLAADAVAFAVMIGIFKVAAWIGSQMTASAFEDAWNRPAADGTYPARIDGVDFGLIAEEDKSNVGDIFTISTCIKLCLPDLVAIGGMATLAKTLAKEIVG